jgi:pyruvate dehydrogenase E1 component
MGQPGLTHFEPAFADELAAMMEHGFQHMQAADGGSIYLRLTTRSITQPERADASWRAGALCGAYWLREPAAGATAAIAYMGALAPEAMIAWQQLAEDLPGLGLLAVTSPDLLHRDWSAARAARWRGGEATISHIEALLGMLSPSAGLVTVLDGSPGALSWLGGVVGHKVSPLGTDRFGQTGNLADLYRTYRLDADAIVEAMAGLLA